MNFVIELSDTMSYEEAAVVCEDPNFIMGTFSMRFSSCGSTGLRKYATHINFPLGVENAAHNE